MLNENEKYSILKDKVQSINTNLNNINTILKELEVVIKETFTINGKIIQEQSYNEIKELVLNISNQVSQDILPSIISKI